MATDSLREVLDSLTDPVVVLRCVRDETGAVVDFSYWDANTAACADNRVSYEDMIGQRLLTLFPEHGPSGLFAQYAQVATSGQPLTLNDQRYAHEFFSGEDRYFDIRCAPIEDGVTLTWRDVSERHRARQELLGSEARFRHLAEHASELVYFAGNDQVIRWVSPSVTGVLGWEPSEVVGQRGADLLHPEDREASEADRVRVHEGSPDAPPFHSSGPMRVQTKAGDYRWMVGVLTRVAAEGSEPEGVVASWRDVTESHAATEALAASEARFRLLAENSTDVVLEVDASGLVTWVTPNVEEVLGWSATDLVGRPGADLLHEEDLGLLRANDLRMPGGILRVRTANGDLLPMSVRVTLLDGSPGSPSGAVVGLTDVSALVEARDRERAALQAEAQTRLSMDEAAVGLLIARLDGTITYANPAMHRMLKAPEGALIGVPIGRGSGPADEAEGRLAVSRVVDGTSPTEHLRRSLPDFAGGRVWVDTYLSPIRGTDGAVTDILVQVVDVSAEVASRESLARGLDHFRLLAENATDVVYETDTHGIIQWISPSVREALGWEPAVLVGTLAMDLVHPDDVPMAMRERAEVYQGGEKRNVTVRFRSRDGQARMMSLRAHPLRDESGVITGAVLGLRDVTEEVEAAQALESSERLFRTALEEAPTGMAIADPDDTLVQANPVLARMLGHTPEELIGHRLREFLIHGAESDPTCAELLVATGETRIENHEHQVLDPVAGTEWIAHSVAAVRDRAGAPLFFVHQVSDITATKHREADLGYRADHDLLTGVLNREGLMSRLSEWLPGDSETSWLALLYCDVDRLKDINDEHGHAAGDAVLIEVAHRMHASVRRGDIVARISGDEFVIVLDRIRDVLDALAVAEKVRSGVHGPVAVGDGEVTASVSVGIAVSMPGDTPAEVMVRADAALYRAKLGGRDRVAT